MYDFAHSFLYLDCAARTDDDIGVLVKSSVNKYEIYKMVSSLCDTLVKLGESGGDQQIIAVCSKLRKFYAQFPGEIAEFLSPLRQTIQHLLLQNSYSALELVRGEILAPLVPTEVGSLQLTRQLNLRLKIDIFPALIDNYQLRGVKFLNKFYNQQYMNCRSHLADNLLFAVATRNLGLARLLAQYNQSYLNSIINRCDDQGFIEDFLAPYRLAKERRYYEFVDFFNEKVAAAKLASRFKTRAQNLVKLRQHCGLLSRYIIAETKDTTEIAKLCVAIGGLYRSFAHKRDLTFTDHFLSKLAQPFEEVLQVALNRGAYPALRVICHQILDDELLCAQEPFVDLQFKVDIFFALSHAVEKIDSYLLAGFCLHKNIDCHEQLYNNLRVAFSMESGTLLHKLLNYYTAPRYHNKQQFGTAIGDSIISCWLASQHREQPLEHSILYEREPLTLVDVLSKWPSIRDSVLEKLCFTTKVTYDQFLQLLVASSLADDMQQYGYQNSVPCGAVLKYCLQAMQELGEKSVMLRQRFITRAAAAGHGAVITAWSASKYFKRLDCFSFSNYDLGLIPLINYGETEAVKVLVDHGCGKSYINDGSFAAALAKRNGIIAEYLLTDKKSSTILAEERAKYLIKNHHLCPAVLAKLLNVPRRGQKLIKSAILGIPLVCEAQYALLTDIKVRDCVNYIIGATYGGASLLGRLRRIVNAVDLYRSYWLKHYNRRIDAMYSKGRIVPGICALIFTYTGYGSFNLDLKQNDQARYELVCKNSL